MYKKASQNNTLGNDNLFILDSEEIVLAKSKNSEENKLAFAVMLKFFQTEGKYPAKDDSIDPVMVSSLAIQLNCADTCFDNYDWNNRSVKRFRQEIRSLLDYKKATTTDSNNLISWLVEHVLPQAPTLPQITEQAYLFLRDQRLEPFKPAQLDRYISTACYRFEQQFFADIFQQCSDATMKSIDTLLDEVSEQQDEEEEEEKKVATITSDTASNQQSNTTNETNDATQQAADAETKRLNQIKLRSLKKSIAGAKLKNVSFEIDKIKRLRMLNLPSMFNLLSRKLKTKYYMRVAAAVPSDIKEHKPKTLYASMAIFCHFRSELLTDDLVETLIQLIHKIRTSAEISINKNILSEVKCVNGKFDILYKLAATSAENPTGVIEDTIYPKVSKEILSDLAIELISNKGTWYQKQVQKKMLSAYSHSHRRVLLTLLEIFVFNTSNEDCKPILQAIEFIRKNKDSKDKYYSDSEKVPAIEAIASKWRSMVVEEKDIATGSKEAKKINRINYEVAILEELHDLLSCKKIWVEGAYRFRDPEEDLPKDFDLRPEYYYKMLNLPMDASVFVKSLQDSLNQHLQELNDTIPTNNKVKIVSTTKNGDIGRIKITPYQPQVEPSNLVALQQTINERWPAINLIDILKEADLRIGFTKAFTTVASRANINKHEFLKRLLLCLYAIGSNTGLKRISGANEDVSYSDLRYIKRLFINVANVRQATTLIVNAILEIRDPLIWGTATTGCACDSTKVSSWDQNLMTQWHTRYRGRGVMIYWHVDKNSACIYSQLKTCSSSEVGSMIKGVLDHCSKMDMKEAYVDTHGQSTIGYGLSHLLHLDLLARLKNINKQKLHYSTPKDKVNYQNLQLILKSAINWDLIKKHYHETVKRAVALKIGTVEPEVMLKHLSSNNYTHPVYQALTEIGNATKTIFLCRYLMSEELRIEIHEALNVVERLNSIMDFIFYGKLGEISTNNRDDQELAIVCLHLLQVCMVYINTLIIQEVLSDRIWRNKLTIEDKRGLTPLIHAHINPYGLFPLDLNKRVIIERRKAL